MRLFSTVVGKRTIEESVALMYEEGIKCMGYYPPHLMPSSYVLKSYRKMGKTLLCLKFSEIYVCSTFARKNSLSV